MLIYSLFKSQRSCTICVPGFCCLHEFIYTLNYPWRRLKPHLIRRGSHCCTVNYPIFKSTLKNLGYSPAVLSVCNHTWICAPCSTYKSCNAIVFIFTSCPSENMNINFLRLYRPHALRPQSLTSICTDVTANLFTYRTVIKIPLRFCHIREHRIMVVLDNPIRACDNTHRTATTAPKRNDLVHHPVKCIFNLNWNSFTHCSHSLLNILNIS